MGGGEELRAFAVGVDLVRDAARHLADPVRHVGTRRVIGGYRRIGDRLRKAAHDRLRKLLFLLRAGERRQRGREKSGSESGTHDDA